MASSRAISDAAGVNLAAITYYFGSKDELVAEALADELRDWLGDALDLLAEPTDPAARMLTAVQALSEAFDQARDRAPGMLEGFVHAARHPETRDPITELWREINTMLARTIDVLRTDGAVPSWVEPESMAALILAVGAGTVVTATVDPAGVAHTDIAAQFAGLLLAAGTSRPEV